MESSFGRRGSATLAILVATGMLSACGSIAGEQGRPRTQAVITPWDGAKAYLRSSCPIAGAPTDEERQAVEVSSIAAGIVAAVAPKLLDKGLDWLTEYLKEQKDKLSATTSMRAAGEMYTLSDASGELVAIPKYRCLVLVRGTFGNLDTNSTERGGWFTQQHLKNFHLVRPPALYLETRLIYLNEGRQLVLRPALLDYQATAAERVGEGKKDVLVTVAMKTSQVEKGETKERTFATFTLPFPKLKIGSRFDTATLAGLQSNVQPIPPAVPKGPDTGSRDDVIAFQAEVSVVETDDGGELFVKASEIANESKEDVSKQILELIKKLVGTGTEEK